MNTAFTTVEHKTDLCIIGGGLAGLCAAVAAARHGIQVVLMQERPMLGGNASSEIRMWICGAGGGFDNMRETGIIEELLLENQYRNPDKNYSIWDGILYGIAARQPGITLLLNCSCNACDAEENRIKSVTGWQLTTQEYHKVYASIFADCSGDSVLAPLTGARYFLGREAAEAYKEIGGQAHADLKTMGLSCLMQARYEPVPSEFIPPEWANHYTKEDLPYRLPDLSSTGENFWFIEIGGDKDSIRDTESLRDELLRICYGVWDFCKNAPENKEKNRHWRLDWMGILPGKRESRRYEGDYVLTQNDLADGVLFDDIVAYGGWSMDDHNPAGFYSKLPPNKHHRTKCPYGIPYRSLYSVNIENLMFAGRNISATHIALSSTRVMATCAVLGQAVGTAAAIAVKSGLTPRSAGQIKIREIQRALMNDDCYLPSLIREVSKLTKDATLLCPSPHAENLRNGIDRPVGSNNNGCRLRPGEDITYCFEKPVYVQRARIVFDSDLNRDSLPDGFKRPMLANRPENCPDSYVPTSLVRKYRLEAFSENGEKSIFEVSNNYQRLNYVPIKMSITKLRLVPTETWGAPDFSLFSFELE